MTPGIVAVSRPLINSVKILYGQSIGGAVSIDLASRNPEAVGLLLVWANLTFTSRLDQSVDSREHIHDSAESHSVGATLSISLCISVSPEMGIRD